MFGDRSLALELGRSTVECFADALLPSVLARWRGMSNTWSAKTAANALLSSLDLGTNSFTRKMGRTTRSGLAMPSSWKMSCLRCQSANHEPAVTEMLADGLRIPAPSSAVVITLQRLKAVISLRSLSRILGLSLGRLSGKSAALSTIVEDGLVAEWRLDEGSGQTITDCTGNGHNGVLGFMATVDSFDPTWTAQGLSFDGTEAAWFADAVGISGGVARTVIAVVKTGPSAQFGMEWTGTRGNGERWALDRSGAGTLRLDIRGTDFTSALALPASTWCFIAATQSGADLDTVRLYLNGASEASGLSATINTTNGFIVGETSSVTKEMEAAYILVYDRALSAAEVEQNRRALKSILARRGITLPW